VCAAFGFGHFVFDEEFAAFSAFFEGVVLYLVLNETVKWENGALTATGFPRRH
jgi:hypothetical protein